MKKRKIGIIGLGLIGGSIAFALRDEFDIVGYDTDLSSCDHAREIGLAEIVSVSEMRDCDIVFVCVPVCIMKSVLEEVAKELPNVIVTDVASVKAPFAETGGRYVGGHPMAGTEKGGIRAAKPHLFENAYWVITGNGKDADTVQKTVEYMGAKPLRMTAVDHDRAVAQFSHAPHALAYALVTSTVESGVAPIAGSGFFDTTRIAGSSGDFWAEVFRLNKDNVLPAIDGAMSELAKIKDMLASDSFSELADYMNAAKQKRDALFCENPIGGYALYVDLVDRIGEFERVTGTLARAGINVASIALMPGREESNGGALRLEFDNGTDRLRAAQALGITVDKETV